MCGRLGLDCKLYLLLAPTTTYYCLLPTTYYLVAPTDSFLLRPPTYDLLPSSACYDLLPTTYYLVATYGLRPTTY